MMPTKCQKLYFRNYKRKSNAEKTNLAVILDMSRACSTFCVENALLSNRFEYLGGWNGDMNVGTLSPKSRTAYRGRGDSKSVNIERMSASIPQCMLNFFFHYNSSLRSSHTTSEVTQETITGHKIYKINRKIWK